MTKKERVLNVLVAGHSQHGKSSLIEAIVGEFPDNLDYELAHGTTVSLKVIQFHLREKRLLLNFLDSPGHADFKGGIALGLEFADLLLLIIAGNEGFQARTYWLYEKAIQKDIPIIIAATKMDLSHSNTHRIKKGLEEFGDSKNIRIIETSAKKGSGIEEVVNKISLYVKRREKYDKDPKFIILGFSERRGIGELLNIGMLEGKIKANKYLTEKIKIRQIFSLENKPIKEASEGEIVQISLNITSSFSLGTKYHRGKFFSPKIDSELAEILPRKEFYIKIDDVQKFKIALDLLDSIKRTIPSFDFYIDKKNINILVLGDLQFDFIKDKLEQLIEFRIIGSKVKGIITINKISVGNFQTARVKIYPRFKKRLTVQRIKKEDNKMYDMLGASVAYDAFHLDGLHVDVYSGKNEDDIAQAIANAIEKNKLIKIIPHQDVIVKVENYHDLYSLIEKYEVEVLYQNQANIFFLQIKNEQFESFFNSLMKVSNGRANINLFKFDQGEKILSVDPGTRHFGFSLIERGELPSLWYVNLKKNIEDQRTHNNAWKQLKREMNIFLQDGKELVGKIFIGNGPGSQFIIDFLIDYFNIPCENNSCIISDFNADKDQESEDHSQQLKFRPPEIYLVDEFKTSKEALFHLQQGKLVSEVKSKGFVDHAIAALLIAKRGIKGEIIKIKKKPLNQLHEYVVENFAGSYSFKSIHNINNLDDLSPGIYLRVKDASRLDSNLNNGDIITFTGFGSGYSSVHGTTLTGNRIQVKFHANVSLRKEFFEILVPVKER